jgi:arylformamidase
VEPRDRVLIKTRNSARDWRARPFSREFVALAPDAAAWLAERGASLVGIDYVSVDPFGDSFPAHEILLGAGIWIIEGLYLAGVPVGLCEFACMPLRLAGADGAPARAVLRQFT